MGGGRQRGERHAVRRRGDARPAGRRRGGGPRRLPRRSRLTILDETGISFRDSHWRKTSLALARRRRRRELRGQLGPTCATGRHARRPRRRTGSGSYEITGMVVVPAQHRVRGRHRARPVEGPAAARRRRDAQGTPHAGRRPARDAATPARRCVALLELHDAGAVVAAGEPGVLRRCPNACRSWSTSSPGKVLDVARRRRTTCSGAGPVNWRRPPTRRPSRPVRGRLTSDDRPVSGWG